jgi:hypothetical protein
MTQNNQNDANEIEKPNTTTQVPVNSEEAIGKDVETANEPVKEQPVSSEENTAESPTDEEMDDDAPDEEVDAGEEDDESSTPPSAPTTNDSSDAQTASTPPAKANQEIGRASCRERVS